MSANSPALNSIIRLENVSKMYQEGSVQALNDVSLRIDEGEYVCITGPSGCGKTTLLNMMGALDLPSQGKVFFRNELLSPQTDLDRLRSREIGFVFQSFYLLPNLTAAENIQIPMMEGPWKSSERIARARQLLEDMGLGDREKHLPSQLSIGQQQRVAIARSLANHPKVLLADEPTGNLDSESGQEVISLLNRLRDQQRLTLIMITHDPILAANAPRVIRMKDGRIVQNQP